MGKGDKKTAKGKRVLGSYGNVRKRKSSVSVALKSVENTAEEQNKPEVSGKKSTTTKKTKTKA